MDKFNLYVGKQCKTKKMLMYHMNLYNVKKLYISSCYQMQQLLQVSEIKSLFKFKMIKKVRSHNQVRKLLQLQEMSLN